MNPITEREQEIAHLREQKGFTLKAIGEQLHISPGRASNIYQNYKRKRREEKLHEQICAENQLQVSFNLTLGELVIMRRILQIFADWHIQKEPHTLSKWCECLEDIDYSTAKVFIEKFYKIEHVHRKPAPLG